MRVLNGPANRPKCSGLLRPRWNRTRLGAFRPSPVTSVELPVGSAERMDVALTKPRGAPEQKQNRLRNITIPTRLHYSDSNQPSRKQAKDPPTKCVTYWPQRLVPGRRARRLGCCSGKEISSQTLHAGSYDVFGTRVTRWLAKLVSTFHGKTLSRLNINDTEHADRPAAGYDVMRKIQRPLLVRCRA